MSIGAKAISALKWATAAKAVVQVASWAGTLIVVRLLTPEDYGLMAKVAVVCGLAGAIAELGLGAAIVRMHELVEEDLRKIFGFALALGLAMTLALIACAPLIADLFHEDRLRGPIVLASLQIVIDSAALIPLALATRSLSFRLISKIEMAAGVITIAATLVLAWLGAGVWALVLGTLLGAIVRSVALLVSGERVRPGFPPRGIGEHLKFGLTLVANRVSYFVVVQSDVLIGSGFLTTTEIGHYAVALQLATLPMNKVMGTINQIALPAVAQQREDLGLLRAGVIRSIGLIALFAFPALWGISAVAPELVGVLLGSNWLDAIPALMLLPLVVPLRMISTMLFTASLALGNRRLDLRNTIANLILLPSGFFIGAHWGLVGLCVAWLVAVPLAYVFSLPPVMRFVGMRPMQLIRECGPPAIAGAIMYAAVANLRPALQGMPPLFLLIGLSLAGAIVYVAVMAIVSRRHLTSAFGFGRALVRRNAPKTT